MGQPLSGLLSFAAGNRQTLEAKAGIRLEQVASKFHSSAGKITPGNLCAF